MIGEESAEHLVRLYLESRGYLVVTGRKFQIEKGVYPEVDIVAIHPKTNTRILGEVKAWMLQGCHIREVWGRSHVWQRRLRIVNNPDFRRKLVEKVEREYGGNFKVYLYVGSLQPKHAENLKRTIKGEGIELITMDKVISKLLESKRAYSKDPAMQLLVYLKRMKKLSPELH